MIRHPSARNLGTTLRHAVRTRCLVFFLQVHLSGVTLRDSVSEDGATVAIWGNTTLNAASCVLHNNTGTWSGALDLNGNSSSHLAGLRVFNNSATKSAGGMWVGDDAPVREWALSQCICCSGNISSLQVVQRVQMVQMVQKALQNDACWPAVCGVSVNLSSTYLVF
jgi:hypothetical protein